MENQGNQATLETLSLNGLLDLIEADLGKMGAGVKIDPIEILLALDLARIRIDNSLQQGNEVKAEATQFDYLIMDLQKQGKAFIHEIGGEKRLLELRQQYQPTSDNVWWFLDEDLEKKQKASFRKLIITLGISLGIITLLVIGYNLFLAPDPLTIKKFDLSNNMGQAIQSQDYTKALNLANQALLLSPGDPDLLTNKGVILQKLGRNDEANIAFQQAEHNFGSREKFLLGRAPIYLQFGDAKRMLTDSQEILKLNPKSTLGYFYFGKANEALGNVPVALDSYDKASALAIDQGQTELAATIRVTMAMLLQSNQFQLPTLIPTPTQ